MIGIWSFSGGKDSTAMIIGAYERGIKMDRILCVDTTKEFPGMYRHIQKVKDYIHQEIEIIPIEFDYYFSEHIKTKGKNKGKAGYGWPDSGTRWCTSLKRQAIKRATRNIDTPVIEYHGIAFDERSRCANNPGRDIRYPLVQWEMTEKDAMRFCYDRGFDWGGLYQDFHRVSCFCCPLSRITELYLLYWKYPKQWEAIKKMDKKSYRQFRADYSVDELENKFQKIGPVLF